MNKIHKLNRLSEGNTSDWVEKALWRKHNKNWLTISSNIAIKILSIMEEQNINKNDIVKQLNISMRKLNLILSGSYNFDIKLLCELETILNCKLIMGNDIKEINLIK